RSPLIELSFSLPSAGAVVQSDLLEHLRQRPNVDGIALIERNRSGRLAGDAAARIPASTYETNLAAMLQAARTNGVERVIVVAGPDTDGGAPYNDAPRSAAQSANAAVVDLTALAGPLGSATNHAAADAIAAAIG